MIRPCSHRIRPSAAQRGRGDDPLWVDPAGWRKKQAHCSDCARTERGGPWIHAWCAQQSHQKVGPVASDCSPLRHALRRSNQARRHAGSGSIARCSVPRAMRSAYRYQGSSAAVATADDAHPERSSRPGPRTSRRRITELGLEQVMAGHSGKAGIDLSGLANPDPVNRSFVRRDNSPPDCSLFLLTIEDPTPRYAAQHPERLG